MTTLTYAFYKGRKAENPHAKLFDVLVTHWPRTRGRFSHGEWVAPDGKCWSSSFRDGGVRPKQIDLDSGRWVKYHVPARADEIAYHLYWFNTHKGMPYDTTGLFGFILPWNTEDPDKVFCSESLAHCRRLERPRKWDPQRLADYLATLPGCIIVE